jgi:hypothetical protein
MNQYLRFLLDAVLSVGRWILRHKMLVFVYLPLAGAIAVSGYVGVVYLQWRADRDQAIQMMARYKQLIDRTEEMREGLVYQSSDVDLSAKVVNIPTRIYDRNGEIIGEFFEQML